jgi:hypothetical protein
MALTMRTSRSWTSRMTWVPLWVRPTPMCLSWLATRSVTVSDPVVGVVAGWSGQGFGHGVVAGCGCGSVWQGAVGSVVVVLGAEPVEQGLQLVDGRGLVGLGA